MNNKKKSLWWKILLAVLLVGIGVCVWYVNDYYHADYAAMDGMPFGEKVTTTEKGGLLVSKPEGEIKAGLIFYPGGKVEYTAYRELMEAFAEEGIMAITVKMPCNLAVLDMNAADGIPEMYPEVEDWYMGGHSLGGAMAASFVAKHAEEYEGLVLLGAYSTADLTETDLDVIAIYGGEDRVMKQDKYEECLGNLPDDFSELRINGGNHAYYGVYGEQEGDGTASISNEEQIRLTAEGITTLLLNQ